MYLCIWLFRGLGAGLEGFHRGSWALLNLDTTFPRGSKDSHFKAFRPKTLLYKPLGYFEPQVCLTSK